MEPLWDRVDRNRLTLAAMVTLFVAGSALGLVVLFAGPWLLVLLYRYGSLASTGSAAQFWSVYWSGLAYVVILAAGAAAAWAGFTLLRSEKWLLKRFDATLVAKGELLDTKFALKDMSLAAGLPVAPALYVMPERSTNAFVFAARRRRAVIGITDGFTRKLTIDQQRAVFANLVARLASGDTILSTGVTALMWPMQAWRVSRMTAGDADGLEAAAAEASVGHHNYTRSAAGTLVFVVFGIGFAVLAEAVAAGQRRALRNTAEKADAEGMLLLKDPVAMVAALRRCIELNNVVPAAGEAFAELFYCWTGIASDDEDDPEWVRVARLREVLGVMGYEPEDEPVESLRAPVAPRLDVPEPYAPLEG